MAEKLHDLYQVYATDTKSNSLVQVPFFPRAKKETCEKWAELMTRQIIKGKEKRFNSPQVLLHMLLD